MSTLLFNFQSSPLGRTLGVAKYSLRLAEALSAAHRIVLILREGDSLPLQASLALPRSTEILHVHPKQEMLEVAFDPTDAVEIRAHHFQPRLTTLKSLTLLHDFHAFDVPWKYPDPESMQNLLRQCMLSSDAIITEFPYTYFHYTQYTGLPANRLFLTGSPILLKYHRRSATAATRRVKALPGPKLFFPAQLQRHKNHLNLVRALAILSKHVEAFLVLTGTEFDRAYEEQLEAEVDRLGLRGRVVHLGNLSDAEMVTLYSSVDATIIPSLAEGGAYVPLEALWFGCPVAVSDLPSIRYHLRSVVGDLDVPLFDPLSPEEIASRIHELLDRGRPPRRTRDPEIALPDWSTVARDWNKVIDWLLGRRLRPFTQVDATYRVQELSDD